jgi:archaellum component FlaG (FlaF/FlaG flagellin family)
MSFYDDASLIMFPSGYKEDKIYSLKPTDGSGDLTFTRASTATRVNAEGLIEGVRTNLVTYSEQLDNAEWTKGGVGTFTSAITTGFVGPFGDNDAQRYVATIGSVSDRAFVRQLATLTSGIIYSVSFWVKSNTGSSQDIYFMFQGGAVQATTATTSWQRISYSATTSTTVVFVGIEAKDLTIDILIYGFQLEVGDVMTDYIPTTTAAVSVGMLADVPRIDYTGGGCAKLLLEPQRTNLVTYSSEFDNAAWTKGSGVSVTANTTIAPTGTLTADTLIGASGIDWTLSVLKRQLPPVLSSTTYTLSIYVKSLGSTTFQTSIRNNNTGSQVTVSHSINSDTWTRVEQTYTTTPTQTLVGVIFGGTDGDVAIWGAQLEAGSYVSSYIPTLASSVTRLADAASKTGISSLIGVNQGSIYVELDANGLNASVANYVFDLSDGTNFNANRISMYWTSANDLNIFYAYGGTTGAVTYTFNFLTTKKVAVRWTSTQIQAVINGVAQTAVTYGNSSPTKLNIGSRFNDIEHLSINTKQCLLFNTTLTAAQLAELTTL